MAEVMYQRDGSSAWWCEPAQSWTRLIWTGSQSIKVRVALRSSGKGSGSRDACAMDREPGATCK